MPSTPPPGLPVLVVEDNQDALEMLLAYLEAQGHQARGAVTAAEGLAELTRGGVRLLVTDYRLPDHSGAWLVRTARERGLLEGVGLLMCTAEHDPEPVEGTTILPKPLDLDRLDREIETALATTHLAAMKRFTDEPGADGADEADDQGGPAPSSQEPSRSQRRVELVLYVTDSMASMRAIRNLRRALETHDASRVRLQLCDLTRDPLGGAADRVSFTPMLVRRSPAPRESLLGDLRDEGRIHDLLRAGAPAHEDHE